MTRHFPPPAIRPENAATLLVQAMRCWGRARVDGRPVQPSLARMLEGRDGMLTPVLDSLVRLYEIALGRPLRLGRARELSADEHLLVDLIGGRPTPTACLSCNTAMASALDCALCSTRIMMGLSGPSTAH